MDEIHGGRLTLAMHAGISLSSYTSFNFGKYSQLFQYTQS